MTEQKVPDEDSLGKTFLESSALSAYGIWIILFLFPVVLAGIIMLIDAGRSPGVLILSSIAIGIIAASYIFRFYLVRNTKSLRTALMQAEDRESALKVISGGFWWWLITLASAIAAVLFSHKLF